MNRIVLIGRLGRDPEMKTLSTGTACCNFSLATSRRWKDKAGVQQEKTEWHRIVAWGKQAEVVHQYLKKGDQFAVTGELRYSEWTDKEGNKRTTAEIHLEDFDFIGTKSRSESTDSRPKKLPDSLNDIPF